MSHWLEQKNDPSDGPSDGILRLPPIQCTADQRKRLEEIAESRDLGIWRVKQAKIIRVQLLQPSKEKQYPKKDAKICQNFIWTLRRPKAFEVPK